MNATSKMMLAVIIACSLPSSNVFAQWQSVEVDTITRVPSEYQTYHQSLAADNDGDISALWVDHTDRRGKMLVSQKLGGGSWSKPVVLTDSFIVGVLSIDSQTDVRHFLLRDRINEFRVSHLYYLRESSIVTKTEIVAIDSLRVSPHSAFLDQLGFLHATWATEASLGIFKIAYLTNKSGQWQKDIVEASDPGRFGAGSDPRIVVTTTEDIVIAYVNKSFGGANTFLAVQKPGQDWQMDYVPFSGNDFGERLVDVAADSSGGLHFVVSGWEGEDLFGKTYYFFRSPEGTWQGPEEIPQSVGPGLISIQTDRFGNPHIVWESHSLFFPPGDAFYSYKNEAGEWQSQPIIEQRNQGGSVSPTFVMDGEGNGHLLLVYFTNSRPDSAHLIYMKSENLVTAVEPTKSGRIPEAFELTSNYPNPFRSQTRLEYHVSTPGAVTLEVFDISGRLIQRQVETHGQPGEHVISWNGKDRFENAVSNGVYFYRIHFLSSHGFRRAIGAGKLLKLQ